MTDTPVAEAPVTISAMERAKEIADRINRNKSALVSISTTLEVKRNAYKHALIAQKEANEDVERLAKEIPALEHHEGQLKTWCAKNLDSDEQVAMATAIAKKIDRLRKELDAKRKELQRLENGLPDTQ
jgi:predicted RNase H-like nuclease (RuvC/YqgF family)